MTDSDDIDPASDSSLAGRGDDSENSADDVAPRPIPHVKGDSAADTRDGAESDSGMVDDEELPFPREPIEPETPTAENALFVVLGVLGTVGLLATAIVPGVL
ncbi:DUF7312 domain-containing protein [Halobellus ordinarius]|uniref:DUF7312 domain-containing protein n=1 Tax=Halobellus ordinarius TaxID=3075120 RepID=UPI002880AF98|nr:hypothetical protein [Halobellus sp. ZY16]